MMPSPTIRLTPLFLIASCFFWCIYVASFVPISYFTLLALALYVQNVRRREYALS